MENAKTIFSLSSDIVEVTRAAAIASFEYIGLGKRDQADQAAVTAMRHTFKNIPIKGTIVIGEGERDVAPMLYIGEKVGMWKSNQLEWDIAVDPLEGTNLCAKAIEGALSVLAIAKKGSLFNAPDIYMEKIACGPAAKGAISLNQSNKTNITKVAKALNKNISQITVAVLNRDRHKKLINNIYEVGARVCLIEDGDVAASILTSLNVEHAGSIDLMMGIGGAPEGVLSASALKCLGADFQGRLIFQNEEEKQRAQKMGITQWDKVYSINELVKSHVVFCATGVTQGPLLKRVIKSSKKIETESLYINSFKNECSKISSALFTK